MFSWRQGEKVLEYT